MKSPLARTLSVIVMYNNFRMMTHREVYLLNFDLYLNYVVLDYPSMLHKKLVCLIQEPQTDAFQFFRYQDGWFVAANSVFLCVYVWWPRTKEIFIHIPKYSCWELCFLPIWDNIIKRLWSAYGARIQAYTWSNYVVQKFSWVMRRYVTNGITISTILLCRHHYTTFYTSRYHQNAKVFTWVFLKII